MLILYKHILKINIFYIYKNKIKLQFTFVPKIHNFCIFIDNLITMILNTIMLGYGYDKKKFFSRVK